MTAANNSSNQNTISLYEMIRINSRLKQINLEAEENKLKIITSFNKTDQNISISKFSNAVYAISSNFDNTLTLLIKNMEKLSTFLDEQTKSYTASGEQTSIELNKINDILSSLITGGTLSSLSIGNRGKILNSIQITDLRNNLVNNIYTEIPENKKELFKENKGYNRTTYGEAYGTSGYAWCSTFATYLMDNTTVEKDGQSVNLLRDIIGVNPNTRTNANGEVVNPHVALDYVDVFANGENTNFYLSEPYNGKFNPNGDTYTPKVGDVVFYYHNANNWDGNLSSLNKQNGHVGIIDSISADGTSYSVVSGNAGTADSCVVRTDKVLGDTEIIGYGSWYEDSTNKAIPYGRTSNLNIKVK